MGFSRVKGTVLESYFTGARPQVVVVIPSAVERDEASTVTLPVVYVEPAKSAHSSWAEQQRYEVRLKQAVQRVAAQHSMRMFPADPSHEFGIDFFVESRDGAVAVEAKHSTKPLSSSALQRMLRQLRHIGRKRAYARLLVTDAVLPKEFRPPSHTGAIRWRNEKDDRVLAQALLFRSVSTPADYK